MSFFAERKTVSIHDNTPANHSSICYEDCCKAVFDMRLDQSGSICRFLGIFGQATRKEAKQEQLCEIFV
jgi:hypothetical protein